MHDTLKETGKGHILTYLLLQVKQPQIYHTVLLSQTSRKEGVGLVVCALATFVLRNLFLLLVYHCTSK